MLFRLALRIISLKQKLCRKSPVIDIKTQIGPSSTAVCYVCLLLFLNFVFSLSFSRSLSLLGFFSSFLLLALHLSYARFCDTRIKPCELRLLSADMGFGIYEVIRVEDMCAVGLFTPLTMPKRDLCSQGIHTVILAIFFGQACSSFM